MDTLNIVIAFAVLSYLVPRLITKPTNIDLIDNTVVYLEITKSYLINASLFLALVLYLVAHYGPSQPTVL